MPQLHKYKCLNANCPGTGRKDDTGLFLAFNNASECPSCSCLKVEDWGEQNYGKPGPYVSQPASFGKPGAAARIDGRLNMLAEAHGMTDINNSGGGAAMGAKPQADGEFGNFTMAGVTVPINNPLKHGITTGSAMSAVKATASQGSKVGTQAGAALKGHTQVTAEHRG